MPHKTDAQMAEANLQLSQDWLGHMSSEGLSPVLMLAAGPDGSLSLYYDEKLPFDFVTDFLKVALFRIQRGEIKAETFGGDNGQS